MTSPFDLNLRHLRALPLIVEHGSMSAAADAIGLSQPALAQGIAKLEAQFGVALFTRRSDGMTATANGLLAIERIKLGLARLSQAMHAQARTPRRGFDKAENLLTATQFRAFLALVEAGSFVGAARATGISQPALHRAVRELEAVAGLELAVRQGRRVVLTESGKRIARGFRLAAAELLAALSECKGADAGHIAIGAMPLCRARLLPKTLARFSRISPAVHIDIAEGSYNELIEPLRDGRIDMMIGALRETPPPDLRQHALFEDRLAIVGRNRHPLAGDPDIPVAALSRFPWIVGRADTPLRAHWQRLFASADLPVPNAPIECSSVMTIRGVLLETDFLTLVSPDQVALELRSGQLAIIGPPVRTGVRTIGVISRADWQPTLTQGRFLDLLDAIAADTKNPEFG